jgi:hypothetical protein
MAMGYQRDTRPLSPEKSPGTIWKRLGRLQGRCRRVWAKRKIFTLNEDLTMDGPTRIEILECLLNFWRKLLRQSSSKTIKWKHNRIINKVAFKILNCDYFFVYRKTKGCSLHGGSALKTYIGSLRDGILIPVAGLSWDLPIFVYAAKSKLIVYSRSFELS